MARRDSMSIDRDVDVDSTQPQPYAEHHRTPSATTVPGNARPLRSNAPVHPPPPHTTVANANLSSKYHAGPGSSSSNPAGARDIRANMPTPGYTLMFAGRSVGKTSLLRLLLDTLDISPRATPMQSEDVARFVYGAAERTAQFCAASIEVMWESEPDNGRHILFNLIDTPSLDANNPTAFERSLSEIIRVVESKFMESIDHEHKYRSGDHHVHLCIYLLDPDTIVPTPSPKSIPHQRTRADSYGNVTPADSPVSFTHSHNSAHQAHNDMPHLPASEIHAIKTLSQRVNVLPVIARADTVTAERLAVIKRAVREDLADAGIGFGIFDNEQQDVEDEQERLREREKLVEKERMAVNGYDAAGSRMPVNGKGAHDEHLQPHPSARIAKSTSAATSSTAASTHRGSMSSSVSSMTAATSPPLSPYSQGFSRSVEPFPEQPAQVPRLPHAVLSPDAYSHSEGFSPCSIAGHGGQFPPTLQELVKRYSPGYRPNNVTPTVFEVHQGRFLRRYRWGVVDPLNVKHCDFIHLRNALFHHMQPLRSYTREYLFEKFRVEIHHQRQHLGAGSRHDISHRANASLSASASASVSPVPHAISARPHHSAHPPNLAALPPPTPHNRPSSAASSIHPHSEPAMSRLGPTSLPPLSNAQYNPQPQQLPPLSAVTSAASDYDFDGDHEGVDGDGRYARRHRGSGSTHSRRPPSTGSLAMSPDLAQSTGHRLVSSSASSMGHGRPPFGLQLPPHPHPHAHNQHPNGIVSGTYTRPPSDMDNEMRPPTHSASAPATAGGVPLSGYGFKSADSSKQRNKKITVACNFCRSRKLKCDGLRPACGQCIKRQNECDYMPQAKRRGATRHRHSNSGSGNGNDDEGDGDGSGDASSGDDQPHHPGRPYEDERGRVLPGLRISDTSADSMHESISRRGSGNGESATSAQHSPRNAEHDRDRDARIPYANSYSAPNSMVGSRSPYAHATLGNGNGHGRVSTPEKPQLSPLPFSGSGGGLSPVGNGTMSASSGGTSPGGLNVSLSGGPVPIRPASDAQATQRKRQSANGGKGGTRASSNYGPKVVACNFCRARKTKCDGVHPSCASCARRSLACSYANDGTGGRGRRSGAAAAAAAAANAIATNSNAQNNTSPTSGQPTPQINPQGSPNASRTQSPAPDSVHSILRSTEASPPGSKRGFSDDESKDEVHKRPRIDAVVAAVKPEVGAEDERRDTNTASIET